MMMQSMLDSMRAMILMTRRSGPWDWCGANCKLRVNVALVVLDDGYKTVMMINEDTANVYELE